jgi:hypothetical protein
MVKKNSISKKHSKKRMIKNKKNKTTKTKTKKTISRKSLIKFIGGGEILNPNDFFSNLKKDEQSKILSSINLSDMSLEDIKNNYKNQQQQKYHLYDFIFDLNLNKQPKLIKVWDHMRNDPESITAGLPGIHIYVIIDQKKDNTTIFKIIGKFTRT